MLINSIDIYLSPEGHKLVEAPPPPLAAAVFLAKHVLGKEAYQKTDAGKLQRVIDKIS
jgi:hypothetical protein